MKRLLLLIIILGVVSCKSTKRTGTTENQFVVENLAGLSAEEIRQKYPDANIREDVGMFEEGTEERPYSILYPDTPNEIHITWADENRTKMEDIRFTENNSNWSSAEGIRIGTTYEQLNEINEKEISFYGFGWDYSGAVDWNDGKLEKRNLRVFLAPEGILRGKHYGDHIIEATPEEIKNMDLRVQTIIYKL